MRVVPINEAEAIIEPFWDGGSSEHPTDKYSVLSEYQLTISEVARGRIVQSWCAADVILDTAPVGNLVAWMERECDLDLTGYDIFRAFASVPHWVRMTVRAIVDDQSVVLLNGVIGGDTHDEFDGKVRGKHLTHLRLEFAVTENRPTYIELLWLGLANRKLQKTMESRTSSYDAQWKGLLATQPGDSKPGIGIFFGESELASLRKKIARHPYNDIFGGIVKLAENDLAICNGPEKEIGIYVPNPDRRWCRNRDMQRTRTAGIMERLAFVGLLTQNNAMSQLAARMALSAAHCDYWCESIIGVFPGASWHHRSFTEEIYCRACALVLDWAGFCLTEHGKQVIRDAIIMKGLPRIESDFKRMEYIRHMNQGIVFSSGRIIGLMGVLPSSPRYAAVVTDAERDLREMIDSYVQPDGGILEGMAYWNYTFSTAMPLFYALARYHGYTNLKDYGAEGGLPTSLVQTGDYALGMMSTSGDGTTYLPINDAHADQRINPALIAAYCQISARPEWKSLYARTLDSAAEGEDMYHIIFAPAATYKSRNTSAPRFSVLPDVGEVSYVRKSKYTGLTHFHLSCGPILRTHYHQDRGSFVLEANGEVLVADRGVTTYDHPEVGLIGAAHRHNLLYPELPDGRFVSQPPEAIGGVLCSTLMSDDGFALVCDNTLAWEPGIFRGSIRRVVSPTADLYVVDDDVLLQSVMPVSFRINTHWPIKLEGDSYLICAERTILKVTPLNWSPVTATYEVEGIDSHLQPVNMLKLAAQTSATHRLLTGLQILPVDYAISDRWTYEVGKGITVTRGADQLRVLIGRKPAIRFAMSRGDQVVFHAVCNRSEWESKS